MDMDKDATPTLPPRSRIALLKAALSVAFITAAVILVRFTSLKDYLTAEASADSWLRPGSGPVLFMLIYVVGVCLFRAGGDPHRVSGRSFSGP